MCIACQEKGLVRPTEAVTPYRLVSEHLTPPRMLTVQPEAYLLVQCVHMRGKVYVQPHCGQHALQHLQAGCIFVVMEGVHSLAHLQAGSCCCCWNVHLQGPLGLP